MAKNTASVVTAVSDARTPESSLLDHVERVMHSRVERFAVIIHLSSLSQHNRQPYHIRIAARSFDTITNGQDVQLYTMSNNDLVLMCNEVDRAQVDEAVGRLRILFRSDPVAAGDDDDGGKRFVSVYGFDNSYEKFLDLARDWAAVAKRNPSGGAGFLGRALDPNSLAKIDEAVSKAPIAQVMKEQPAVVIGAAGLERILFREKFVSMSELQMKAAPGYDLFSNPWLFLHLTETIDKRVLGMLVRENFADRKDALSINMNVKSVLSTDFQKFDEAVGVHTEKVVIELQQIDVFSDIENFTRAQNWLRDRGYLVLLDGLNPISLQYFNPGLLPVNYYKVAWGTEFIEAQTDRTRDQIGDLVDKVGKDRFILARTDTEQAVRWALGLGIQKFQGYFVDRLVKKQAEKSARARRAKT
ncbi:MAG: EAL domain-containing protein [Rhodospirillales bacterium]|nr:EAL domain-containing protein [Rhodospirillales bacterium]